mgnify:FL=1
MKCLQRNISLHWFTDKKKRKRVHLRIDITIRHTINTYINLYDALSDLGIYKLKKHPGAGCIWTYKAVMQKVLNKDMPERKYIVFLCRLNSVTEGIGRSIFFECYRSLSIRLDSGMEVIALFIRIGWIRNRFLKQYPLIEVKQIVTGVIKRGNIVSVAFYGSSDRHPVIYGL